jgi:tetratricopeptide (TPR) repeat protein
MSQIESTLVTDKTTDGAAGAPGDATTAGARLHMGIAEQGKVYALAGKHALALQYYRHAIHMAVQAGDPEIFFRHYLECVMESLEQMGAHVEVLAYCEKAVAFYGEHPPTNLLEQRDLAHVYERQGAVLLKSGDKEGAAAAFEAAVKTADGGSQALPLAQTLLRWTRSGLHVDANRVLAEQRRTHYFSVRGDTVDAGRAIRLPDDQLRGSQAM